IGLSGSPTRVVKVENFKIERKGKILKDMDPMLMADQLVQFLIERGAW
ncbi:MAG TPA: electron transfer flavoprotein subunit beta, partial [Candidatus Atribacteria bacterium]|nr:electron transfer flavoprotein subunit beta [Candidatus Atribacteria bacterium]